MSPKSAAGNPASRILVIDDEPSVTDALRLVLSDLGHHVDTAIAKYLRALDGGVVPIELLFSGSIFHTPALGTLSVSPIPWSKEAHFSLPRALVRQPPRASLRARHHA